MTDILMENELVEMEGNLSKQIYIYSLSTDSFLNDNEHELHKEKQSLSLGLSLYKKELNKLEKLKNVTDEKVDQYYKNLSFTKLGDQYKPNKPSMKFLMNFFNEDLEAEIIELLQKSPKDIEKNQKDIKEIKKDIRKKKIELFKPVKERINKLKELLDNEADQHKGVRVMRQEDLKDSNKVSQFDSVLTRTLGVGKNSTTTDIIMIRAFRYKVFESLVKKGFYYYKDGKRELYKYYTSSAGAIRNKKSIFMRESVSEKVKNALNAGLTIDKINEQGGMNVNKYNAYTALTMTASVPWEGFDIDKCIVVDDFETDVWSKVEHIDSETYEITPDEKYISIPHTDGAGICLLDVSEKAIQIRLPYFKGLIVPFNFKKFIDMNKEASPIVYDIWNEPHNVIEKGITTIFTKSQFKMWKFFDDWDAYKRAFKQYNCQAAIASEEENEDSFTDKTLSYQVLQTLTDFKEGELSGISSKTVNQIKSVGNDKDIMLEILGVTSENDKKSSFQQALEIYPNLLNDVHSKETIKETKKSLITRAKSGKLILNGTKRTFISPDTYAFAQWLF
ncbi:hypothetical protein [Halalkalibacter okhensis]|uniref:hypothetical protein n=1 Tax=Halalkalibacter okhensis TaxID=333138 RepID=UPI000689AB9C|nr:hypothetical protein [Halalkalibacter okhensis]